MMLKRQLVRLLSSLPNTQEVKQRKVLITLTGLDYLARRIDWQGDNLTFFTGLIDILTWEGQAALVGFIDNLIESDEWIGLEGQKQLKNLKQEIAELDADQWPREFIGDVFVSQHSQNKNLQQIELRPESGIDSIRLGGIGESDSRLPNPDAGRAKRYSVTPKPAFSINPALAASKWIPFDIGTLWGLERRSLIGILIGFEGDGVYENLISVESILLDALEEKPAISLPTRRWIRIEPSRYDSGPQRVSQVCDAAVGQDNPLIEDLQQKGLPDSIIPGIFLEISGKKLNDNKRSLIIQNWCDALVNKIFAEFQVSIIIHIDSNLKDLNQQFVLDIKNKISNRVLNIPIQTLILKEAYIHTCKHLQLDKFVSVRAASSSLEVRREAIIFARSKEDIIISDILMDAWVEGSELKPERIPEGRQLNAYSKTFVNELTWAILRQFRQSPEKVKSIIEEKLQPNLLRKFIPVCDFCLDKIQEDCFLNKAKDEHIELAIRAGAEIKQALDKFKIYGLDKPVFAWLVTGIPPSSNYISALLNLNKDLRAIFGLCTHNEWQQIAPETVNNIFVYKSNI